jgi:hypothetical protein
MNEMRKDGKIYAMNRITVDDADLQESGTGESGLRG